MTNRSFVGLHVALLASGLFTSAMAVEQPVYSARIVAHGTFYALGRTAFDDLDALERAVQAASPRSIELGACGAAASRALLAASHRFRNLPQRLQVFDANAGACAAVPMAIRAGLPQGHRPTGIDESSVDRYWREVAP